jgi:hypothetical protein
MGRAAEVHADSLQNVASGALKGHQKRLSFSGDGRIYSQAFQMMLVSEGPLRAVWRARDESQSISGLSLEVVRRRNRVEKAVDTSRSSPADRQGAFRSEKRHCVAESL